MGEKINLLYKINLIYNFLYNLTYLNCFKIDKINLGEIELDDIKLVDEKEINEYIEDLNKSTFSYLKYNEKETLIYFKRYSDSYTVTVKIGTYTNDINKLNNSCNNDALFSYLLSQLVLNKKTIHILLPIVNFDVPFEKIDKLIKNIPIYNLLKGKIEFNEIKNIFSVRIREHFFTSISLEEYLSENTCLYKPLLFQIIHTLAVIQKEFPGFRHNNLTPENILIYKKKKNLSNNVYEYDDKKWVIPDIDFDIKMTNFEKSCIPKMYGIMNQRDTDVPYITEFNDYFDLHTFLNSLIEGNYKMSTNNSYCDQYTKKFLNNIIPEEFRGLKKGSYYLYQNVVLFRPEDLLNDPYFDEYKNIKEIPKENLLSNIYYTNMNKNDIDSNRTLDTKKRYMIRKLNTEDTSLVTFNSKKESLNMRKLKGGALFENPYVEKPEVMQSTENKKILNDDVRQLKPTENIPGNKPPFQPRGDKPYIPRENKPYIPRENKPYIPREDKPYIPRENKPYIPRENKPYIPREDKPPYQPTGDKPPYQPIGDKPPYQPTGDKPPYQPTGDKPPFQPRSDKPPYQPRSDKPPYQPTYDKPRTDKPPYQPRDDRPTYDKPRTDKPPFQPTGDNPQNNKKYDVNKTLEPPVEKFEIKKSFDSDFDKPDIPPGMIPLYDPNNTLISSMGPYNFSPNQPPIHKIYNISLSDPLGNHSLINKVYEDVLPGDQTTYSFIKLNEREAIKYFMRNSILDKYDGEEFSLKGGNKSLLSWVKIFDINPYTLKDTPYQDIPYNFLLYRSAYPIRYNKETHVLKTTPNSMAFNLRIYKLSVGAIKYLNIQSDDRYHFDVWRDIEYYNWVNTIIKQKISPNFINLILYILDNKSKIGFKDLDIIKKNNNIDSYRSQIENNKKINKIKFKDIPDKVSDKVSGKVSSTILPPDKVILAGHPTVQSRVPTISIDKDEKRTILLPDSKVEVIDYNADSNKVLVALTEAPNTNIIKWNTQIYQSYGTIKKMISTGYHSEKVWISILFQLIYACAVMEHENICFNTFSLKNNVFIKDIQTDGTGNSCWVYKVDNIEYYVPNYGYIVVIDSNYADITDISDNIQYKIYGERFNNNSYFTKKDERVTLFRTYLKNELTVEKFTDNGNKLNSNIEKKITNIINKLTDNPKGLISEILPKCFTELVNNKVGKLLTRIEKETLDLLSKPNYRKGSVMVRQKRYDEYEWVVYLDEDGNKRKIITKNPEGNVVEESVFSNSLYSYHEPVLPEDKTIIETYTFFN
jgi:hypothetical protein